MLLTIHSDLVPGFEIPWYVPVTGLVAAVLFIGFLMLIARRDPSPEERPPPQRRRSEPDPRSYHTPSNYQIWGEDSQPESRPRAVATEVVLPLPQLLVSVPSPQALPMCGAAAASPPNFMATLEHLKSWHVPIGWYIVDDKPVLKQVSILDQTDALLITGQIGSGKDNEAPQIELSLALRYTPEQVQFAILDCKGLDGEPWRRKRHTWLLATDASELEGATKRITAERRRRTEILAKAGCLKWQEYKGGDIPLLVVYVSELFQLEGALGKQQAQDWQGLEMSSGRALGIRYIVGTQNVSGMKSGWRDQCSLYMAATNPSAIRDYVHTTRRTADIVAAGAVPPSQLPEREKSAGVFCVVHDRHIINVRTSLMSDRVALMARLPEVSQPQEVLNVLMRTEVPSVDGRQDGRTPGRTDAPEKLENTEKVPLDLVVEAASVRPSAERPADAAYLVALKPGERVYNIERLLEAGWTPTQIREFVKGSNDEISDIAKAFRERQLVAIS